MTRRGKSHSMRPVSKRPPTWVRHSPEDVEAFIAKLAKDGNPPSRIGVILRDQYGIPLAKPITGKSITKVLKEAGLPPPLPEDLSNLIDKATSLRRHLSRNRSDAANKRALYVLESKIRRLAKYYKRKGLLEDWEYTPQALE